MKSLKRNPLPSVDEEDLLVFGYSSKLFDRKPPDVDSSTAFSEQNQLILWMDRDDVQLWIDRFDGRALLHQLSDFDYTPSTSFSGEDCSTSNQVSEECEYDSERYADLTDDVDNINESVLQHQQSSSKNVVEDRTNSTANFAYDYENRAAIDHGNDERGELPKEISLASLASSIEKTADFIARQGVQMELMIRTREQNNPLFDFLKKESPYRSVYERVLQTKKGKPKQLSDLEDAEWALKLRTHLEESLSHIFSITPDIAPILGRQGKDGVEKETVVISSVSSMSSASPYSKLIQNVKKYQENEPMSTQVVVEVPEDLNVKLWIDKTAFYVASQDGSYQDTLQSLKDVVLKSDTFGCDPSLTFDFVRDDEHAFSNYFQYKIEFYKRFFQLKNEFDVRHQNEVGIEETEDSKILIETTTDENGSVKKGFPSLKGFFT